MQNERSQPLPCGPALLARVRWQSCSKGTARMDAQRADNVGFWVVVGVMALIAGALYVAHRVLMHRFGDSWATLIVYVPAFCAVFVIAPVQWRVSYFLRRRYCREHGHAPRIGRAHV